MKFGDMTVRKCVGVSGRWKSSCFGCPLEKDAECENCLWDDIGIVSDTMLDFDIPTSDPVTPPDPVNHPAHYNKGGVECIDCIESAVSDLTGVEAVLTGNAIKYLYRWKDKGGVEDLRKAMWYLARLIQKESQ